jgi:hypothetical protein
MEDGPLLATRRRVASVRVIQRASDEGGAEVQLAMRYFCPSHQRLRKEKICETLLDRRACKSLTDRDNAKTVSM